jgi:hypothetical protein
VLVGLLVRLRELTDLVHDIMALRRQIRAEQSRLAKLTFAQGETIRTLQHRDHVMALHSALATILAIGLISAFWIATAWPEGAGAASLAAVACAFFAAQDDPAPNSRSGNCACYRRDLPVCRPAAGARLRNARAGLCARVSNSRGSDQHAGDRAGKRSRQLHRGHPTRPLQQLQRRLHDLRQQRGGHHRRPRRDRDHHPHCPLCQRRADGVATVAA